MPRLVVPIVLAMLLTGAAVAQEPETRDALLDPIPVRDLYLLGNGFYSFDPEGARVLENGEWLVDVHVADANTFSKSNWITLSLSSEGRATTRVSAQQLLDNPRYRYQESLYLVDGEIHRTTISIRHGLGDHLELGVNIPISDIGGGWSDSVIESVHRDLQIGNAGRDAFRQNAEAVYIRTPGVTYMRDRSAGYSLGDVALTAKYELRQFESESLNVAVSAGVELPTGNAATLDGSGSLDAGARIIVARSGKAFRLTGSFGVISLGANKPLGLRPQVLITDTIGVSRMVTDATAAIMQLTVSETPFRQYRFPELSRRSYQLSLGAQHAIHGCVMHVAFIENLFTFNNGVDAALQWGVSRRF
jgi:hypothetical protein